MPRLLYKQTRIDIYDIFFAIGKNDCNFISCSRNLVYLLRRVLYICGKQGPYLHGGIKEIV